MRYGILSDVHGNLEALKVVLERLPELGADELVFLGDAVGYGASPNEVCELLRKTVDLAVIGNHDAAVSGRMSYEEYYDAARDALDWCSRRLTPENRVWLRELPYKIDRDELCFCHGAPFEPDLFEYVFNPGDLMSRGDALVDLAPVTFVGHSHLTLSFRLELEAGLGMPMIAPRIECEPGPSTRHIITVGSVGQPRDRDPRACCGIFDTETRVFTYHRFEYDVHSARQKIIENGLPSVFGDRLLVGV
jgi:diadenosine tetraphosphatase ApaH/serine/threonine PP2A family protein phosphatase